MQDKFQVRLNTIKHMSRMLLEMANVEFDTMTPEQEEAYLEDFEEVANHLLDSMGFQAGPSEDGASFTATFSLQDPEEYIQKKLAEEASANP